MAVGRPKRWVRDLFLYLFAIASFATMAALIVWLTREWRSGTAFTRYRNAEGHLVSHADFLIFAVVAAAAVILGGLWRLWDRRSDDRLVREIRDRQRAHSKPPS